jgi:hypothetical protein
MISEEAEWKRKRELRVRRTSRRRRRRRGRGRGSGSPIAALLKLFAKSSTQLPVLMELKWEGDPDSHYCASEMFLEKDI